MRQIAEVERGWFNNRCSITLYDPDRTYELKNKTRFSSVRFEVIHPDGQLDLAEFKAWKRTLIYNTHNITYYVRRHRWLSYHFFRQDRMIGEVTTKLKLGGSHMKLMLYDNGQIDQMITMLFTYRLAERIRNQKG